MPNPEVRMRQVDNQAVLVHVTIHRGSQGCGNPAVASEPSLIMVQKEGMHEQRADD